MSEVGSTRVAPLVSDPAKARLPATRGEVAELIASVVRVMILQTHALRALTEDDKVVADDTLLEVSSLLLDLTEEFRAFIGQPVDEISGR